MNINYLFIFILKFNHQITKLDFILFDLIRQATITIITVNSTRSVEILFPLFFFFTSEHLITIFSILLLISSYSSSFLFAYIILYLS